VALPERRLQQLLSEGGHSAVPNEVLRGRHGNLQPMMRP
jgi:hypothetical protein